MTDTKDPKAEAKSIWKTIKHYGSLSTAIIADMLKIESPKFAKAETTWKSYTPGKKTVAVVVLALGGLLVWKFGLDITRLSIGSFKAASAYSRGAEVSKSDLSKLPTDRDIANLQDQITSLKADLASMDDKIDKAQTSKVTTGSIRKIAKKSPAKKSSFSVSDPSTLSMP